MLPTNGLRRFAMRLSVPEQQHFVDMMTWFDSKDELFSWSGPNFTYPFTIDSFKADLNLDTLSSYSLLSDSEELLAFGQCYSRLGRCHLGRLAVSPEHRGKNIIATLIRLISGTALQKFDTNKLSLFVLRSNQSAINAYLRYGFKFAEYPDLMPIENGHYMIK